MKDFYSLNHVKTYLKLNKPLKNLLCFTLLFFIAPYFLFAQSNNEQAKIDYLKEKAGYNKYDPSGSEGQMTLRQITTLLKQKKPPVINIDERCGFTALEQMLQKKYPNRPGTQQFENWIERAKKLVAQKADKRAAVTIPVVVHLIEGGSINVSNAQVLSQIQVLNDDFGRTNSDANNTPADFLGVAANLDIDFALATVDPEGIPTNGINRYNGGQTSYSISDFESNIKPNTIWHPDFYFNIWVAPLGGGLLGYAQFPDASGLPGMPPDIGPAGPSFTDGIVVADIAFGVGGTAQAPWDLGRTTTHEAGHFFGFRHIWGDGPFGAGCDLDDFCDDTPVQFWYTSSGVSCDYPGENSCDEEVPGDLPDQFMNYMDYSDDVCMNMFTADQKSRADAVLAFSPRRASLIDSEVENGVKPDYDYDPFADAPVNDLCEGAQAIECDEVVSGTLATATGRDAPTPCSSGPEGPGVWYSFIGDGNTFTISLCGPGTNYDSKIGVYSGSCGDLSCVGGDDDGCGGIGVPSEVSFGTNPGETYYLYVTGYAGSVGEFEFTLTCDDIPPPEGPENDFCEGAILIACGESIDGTTIGATQDVSGSCDGVSVGAPGVWYEFIGNGQYVTASTCNAANYDTKIHVVTGECEGSEFACIGANDDGGGCFGFTSEFSFVAEAGVQYFIYVNGYFGEIGDFTLSVDCVDLPENDTCEGAIALDCESSVEGSTVISTDIGAPEEDCSDDPFSDLVGPGVWYTIQGTGAEITLSTCNSADFDTKIDVFTGSCGDLVCYAGNEDGDGCSGFTSELTFDTDEGITYYVYISGYTFSFFGTLFTSVGDFTLYVDCACVADAGDCAAVYSGYEPAECADLTVEGLYGIEPYEYLWSTGETTATITVCPEETTLYSVIITDAEGCTSEDDVLVEWYDVSCGNQGNKVTVCHVPPGNNKNEKTICIDAEDVEDHLDHGDRLGDCTTIVCGDGGSGAGNGIVERSLEDIPPKEWKISPNPSYEQVYIDFREYSGERVEINLLDGTGKKVMHKSVKSNDNHELTWKINNLTKGIYYVQIKSNDEISVKKLIVIN